MTMITDPAALAAQLAAAQREQVKQYGNAVTPPVMRLLMERVLEILG